jgi:hypothetical protein
MVIIKAQISGQLHDKEAQLGTTIVFILVDSKNQSQTNICHKPGANLVQRG